MREDEKISISTMSKRLGMTENNVGKNLKTLKKKGFIERIGGTTGGYWKVLD